MSEVWTYFSKSASTVSCNCCDFRGTTSRDFPLKTSALWYHLQTQHPDVYKGTRYFAERQSFSGGDSTKTSKASPMCASVDKEKAKTSSEVWKYFAKGSSDAVQCSICEETISRSAQNRQRSTRPMWDHLRAQHYDVFSDTDFCKARQSKSAADVKIFCSKDEDTDSDSEMVPATSHIVPNRTNIPTKAPCKRVLQQAIYRNISRGLPVPASVGAKSLPRLGASTPEPTSSSSFGALRNKAGSSRRSLLLSSNARRARDSSESYSPPTRRRTAFTAEQLRCLEQAFMRSQHLEADEREELAKTLGLPEETVRIWFKNRRTKAKNVGTERLASSYAAAFGKCDTSGFFVNKDVKKNPSVQYRKRDTVSEDDSSIDDDDDDPSWKPTHKARRSTSRLSPRPGGRAVFSSGQLERLEGAFKRSQFVSNEERAKLAKAAGITEEQVRIWFQNRRHKAKNQSSAASGSSATSSLVPEQSPNADSVVVDKAIKQESPSKQALYTSKKRARAGECSASLRAADFDRADKPKLLLSVASSSSAIGSPTPGGSRSTEKFDVVYAAVKQETPDERPHKSAKKRARTSECRHSTRTDDEFDDRLLAEVKRRPALYDHSAHQLTAAAVMEHWQSVADALGSSVDRVHTRWRSLRDWTVKENRRIRSEEEPRWRHYGKMAFYVPFIQKKDDDDASSFFKMVKEKYKLFDEEEREEAKKRILEAVKANSE